MIIIHIPEWAVLTIFLYLILISIIGFHSMIIKRRSNSTQMEINEICVRAIRGLR